MQGNEPEMAADLTDGSATVLLIEVEAERTAEALIFASAEPVSEAYLLERLPQGIDLRKVMSRLVRFYAQRGVNLMRMEDRWALSHRCRFIIRHPAG